MFEDVVNDENQATDITNDHDEEMGLYQENDMVDEENAADAMRHKNAQFILKIKETNLLSQKCLDDSTELVRGTVKSIKSFGLQDCLGNAGINFDAVPGLNDLFTEENPISNPFEHVSTKYRQNAYFKEHFGLVVSDISPDKIYKIGNHDQV